MKILIIGGTGHIGSYLIPRLILSGHEVHIVARTAESKYANNQIIWNQVKWILEDKTTEEDNGTWEKRMAEIETDVVMDMLCFSLEQCEMMYNAFKHRISHFIHCGTIWAYGPTEKVPYQEHFPRNPITEYGKKKAEIERFLFNAYHREGFPATIIHPGHICGRRWLPIDPQGKIDGIDIYKKFAHGEKVYLPNNGLETLNHVHADDVAQLFESAMTHREQALGQVFSAVAPYALTLVGLSNFIASLFGREPNLAFVPLEKMKEMLDAGAYNGTYLHTIHSSCCSIEKAQKLLDYQPRYTTERIFMECIEHMIESGQLII